MGSPRDGRLKREEDICDEGGSFLTGLFRLWPMVGSNADIWRLVGHWELQLKS